MYVCQGGLKAVVWTDTIQAFIMLTGLLVLVVFGSIESGGPSYVYNTAKEQGRFNFDKYVFAVQIWISIQCLCGIWIYQVIKHNACTELGGFQAPVITPIQFYVPTVLYLVILSTVYPFGHMSMVYVSICNIQNWSVHFINEYYNKKVQCLLFKSDSVVKYYHRNEYWTSVAYSQGGNPWGNQGLKNHMHL